MRPNRYLFGAHDLVAVEKAAPLADKLQRLDVARVRCPRA